MLDGILTSLSFLKYRVLYTIQNWVYTTNHKRIAVNYLWFVVFSGTCGMALATVIRLEMAYPGVGILSGDSLQYLSVVTMHAVVMVFFMIMPVIFGAFGNFLLPTQLGVHDVAFPRLNSFAFWFLPGGLLLLLQLVCLDRRYQRMNCFNIRELQALLKTKFLPDDTNPHEHYQFLKKTVIGLRYKTGGDDVISPNMWIFYKLGLLNNSPWKLELHNPNMLDLSNYLPHYNQNSFSDVHYTLHIKTLKNSSPLLDMIQAGFYKSLLIVYVAYREFLLWAYNVTPSVNTLISPDLGKNSLTNSTTNTTLHQVNNLDMFLLKGTFITNLNQYLTEKWWSKASILANFKIDLTSNILNFKLLTDQEYLTKTFSPIFTYLQVPGFDFSLGNETKQFFATNTLFLSNVSLFKDVVKDSAIVCIKTPLYLCETLLNITTDLFNTVNYMFFVFKNLTSFTFTNLLLANTSGFVENFLMSFYWTTFNKLGLQESFQSQPYTTSKSTNIVNNLPQNLSSATEDSADNNRILKASSPVFKYDYRSGNYLPDNIQETFTSMFRSFSEISSGLVIPSWFFSKAFTEFFNVNFSNYLGYYTKFDTTRGIINPKKELPSSPLATDGFYNYTFLLLDKSDLITNRWLILEDIGRKFNKMFVTSSLQQRVFSNWRQLKFTREAWRCKLLSARHQKTLYRRYIKEDTLIWAIERNAKDVLPGWAMVTPFSARTRFTAIGKVDLGLMGVALVLTASIISSSNFLVTYRYLSTLNNRKMRDARAFFTEGVMVTSWMMIAANPMLIIAIFMLLSDRHWQTSFFDYSGGGDAVLFQHMFWFFGHPEVYVIMIPAFGFNNTILSFYLRKRVSARASLLYSMYTIAFLGFFVWGHHMYMVGLAHTTRMLFSTLTVMISVPAATKLMHWCVTLANSTFAAELPLVFQLFFIFLFVSGGISGMSVAHTGMDVLFHDTFFVVGHFHVMLAGSAMFSIFGGFYFYFPSLYEVKYNRIWGYFHGFYYLIGQLMTVVPMMWLGYAGMPRRVLDYPASMGGWHAIISAGHILSIAGMIAFFVMIFDSIRQGRAVTRNYFGIVRFNTRLNFYLYENARTLFIQRKGWYISRWVILKLVTLNKQNYTNKETLETTLYSYEFKNTKIN